MEISEASRMDLEEILRLQKEAYLQEAAIYNDYDILPLKQTLEELEKEFECCTIIKAVEGDCIIGSVRAYELNDTCHIGRLFVKPEHQNKGIGTQLMLFIEKKFQDAARFELFTGKLSIKNIKLYERMKYHIYKEERGMDTISFVFMEKF